MKLGGLSAPTQDVSGLAPTDALVSGLVPTNALATTATGNSYRVAFTSWAVTSQGSLVRSLSRLLLFEKTTTIGVAITQRRNRSAQPEEGVEITEPEDDGCLLYTSPSPRDRS